MEKLAINDHPIEEVLKRRWSPHSFDSRPIPKEVLDQLFEGARWAASSYNEQPWTYIVGVKADDPAQFERLASLLVPQNGWAAKAPVLALSIAKSTFSHDGSPNRVALHDVGAASASLTVQATKENVFVHQMAGFEVPKAKKLFEIPEGFEPVAMLAMGYAGDPETLDEGMKKREMAPRKRKPLDQFVFRGKWGGEKF